MEVFINNHNFTLSDLFCYGDRLRIDFPKALVTNEVSEEEEKLLVTRIRAKLVKHTIPVGY